MASRKSIFLDLPLELLRPILVEAVRIRGLKRALRLRLVNRLFSEEIAEALFASGLSSQCNVPLSKMPFVRPYLEQRLLDHRTTGLLLLNTVHKTAERLAIENGDPTKFEEYAPSLLQLASSVGRKEVHLLLLRGPGYWELEGFEYELLTAAAYTNNVSLVKRLMVPHLGWKHGVFGNPYKAALHGRHINILNVLFEDGPYVGAREKYRLAQNAAENGDDEMVEFILQADWAPRKIFRDGYRPVNEFERALRTRSIKLFNMAMQEKEIVDQSPLMPEVLNRLLRNAINRGWVDMVRHIISLVGVPPESLAKIKFETEQALYCACKAGHDAVVKLLLDRQVHVSGAELEAAASLGHTSTVNLLLEHGADVHSARAQDCLATAAVKGYLGIVRMLLDAGMNPNKGFIVPMIQAVRAEHPGICQLLSERGATMTVAQAIAEVTKRDEFAGQAVAWPDPRARHLPLQLENADRMLQVHRG